MILLPYHIAASRIPGAGDGLFLDTPARRGQILVAPDAIPQVYRWDEVLALPDRDNALAACVLWFEDRYSVTPDWPDECYINHDFTPTGLWHLGFVFAARDLEASSEITVDYRHLLGEGQEETFVDAHSQQPIVGWSWQESLARSTRELAALVAT